MFNSNFKTMKKFKVITVFVVCVFLTSAYAGAVETNKGVRNYEIESVDNVQMGKSVEKVWTLTYEGSENPVTVIKRSTLDGTFYVVNSKFFEVCYLASSNGFGTRSVKKAWSNVPRQINSAVLNAEEIKRQQTLTLSKVDDEKALGLIASYLPGLLNEQYEHLLN
jgi:hypothetical protein